MKKILLVVIAILIVGSSALGESVMLGTATYKSSFYIFDPCEGVRAYFSFHELNPSYAENSLFGQIPLTVSDIGRTFTVTAADSNCFEPIVALLTNGECNQLEIWAGNYGTIFPSESVAFIDSELCTPDFYGCNIASISMTVKNFSYYSDSQGEMELVFTVNGAPRGPTVPKTYTVDDDGPADFNDIGKAVKAAVSGDEIIVEDGVYSSDFAFKGKSLHLRSRNGMDKCVIDCEGWKSLRFEYGEKPSAILEGFTITNGYPHIWIGVSNPTFRNCNFQGNVFFGMTTLNGNVNYTSGGSVQIHGSAPKFINCIFAGNTVNYLVEQSQ